MGTYIIGDIHGCYNKWIQLKEFIEKLDNEATFILVGDIIDRGNNTVAMLDWALNNITTSGKYQMVIGNHEDMKRIWFKIFENTGRRVSDNYDFDSTMKNIDADKLLEYKKFIEKLPYYKEITVKSKYNNKNLKYCIVHADMPDYFLMQNGDIDKERVDSYLEGFKDAKMSNRFPCSLIWNRTVGNNNDNVIVINGHNPTIWLETEFYGGVQGKIHYSFNRINIDCGLVYKENFSNLAAIRLEDLQEFYLYRDVRLNKQKERKELFNKIGRDIQDISKPPSYVKVYNNEK